MATRYFCNGCDRRLDPDEVKTVRFAVATMPGIDASTELRMGVNIEGHLCAACVDLAVAFVSESDSKKEATEAKKAMAA